MTISTPLHLSRNHKSSTKVLLEAGADPTLRGIGHVSALHVISRLNSIALWGYLDADQPATDDHQTILLELMYRHAHHFGISTCRDHHGRSPFLNAFSPVGQLEAVFDPQLFIRRLSLLLSNGSQVNDTDAQGFDCLHVFFSRPVQPSKVAMRDPLVWIINKGADIYGTDSLGRTVSQLAYSETCRSKAIKLGSYLGDLWDVVLDMCGYSISQFRKGFPRRAAYTKRYSRADFENLWGGHKDRCPYWDDVEWHSPDDDRDDDNHGVQRGTICVCLRWSVAEDGASKYNPRCWRDSATRDYDSSSEEGSTCGHGEDQLQDHVHSPASTDGSGSQQPWEGHPSGLGNSDEGTPCEIYSQDVTRAPTPVHDELSHNPWADTQV